MSHEFTRKDFLNLSGIFLAATASVALRLPKLQAPTPEAELFMEWYPYFGTALPKAFADAENPNQSWKVSPWWDQLTDSIPYSVLTSAEITKNITGEIILNIQEPAPDSLLLQTGLGYPLRPLLLSLAGQEIPVGFDGRVFLSALNLGKSSQKVEILISRVAFLVDNNLPQIPSNIDNSDVPSYASQIILTGQVLDNLPKAPPPRFSGFTAASLNPNDFPPPKFFVRTSGREGINYYSGMAFEEGRYNFS